MADLTAEILQEIRSGMGKLAGRMDSLTVEVKLQGTTLRGLVLEQHQMRESIAEVATLLRQVAEDHEHRIAALEAD